MSEIDEIKEAIIDGLICQTLIERNNILAEKAKSELYNNAIELGCEKLKDNGEPLFKLWR